MFPLQSHVISLVIEFQAISVNIMARWIVFRYFTLSLHFTPGLQSAFFPGLHFTPGLQSAVCSPQSAFYTDRLTNYIAVLKSRPFDYSVRRFAVRRFGDGRSRGSFVSYRSVRFPNSFRSGGIE